MSIHSFEGYYDDEDDEELTRKLEDAALEETRQSAAFVDAVYAESQKDIEEGKKILGEIAKSGDTVMGDETAHLKRSADRTVTELDDDEFGQMN